MSTHGVVDIINRNSSDPRQRLELGEQLLQAVQTEGVPCDSTVLTNFMDLICQWLNGTNFKVALIAYDILNCALDVSGSYLLSYCLEHSTSTLMERLGDGKEPVRHAAQEFFMKLMIVNGSTPQAVFDRLFGGLAHKQWLVRIGVMLVLQQILRTFGAGAVQLSKITPAVCKLVADPNGQVRDVASDTLTYMYLLGGAGDRLVVDIQRKQMLPESKQQALFARFEEAKKKDTIHTIGTACSEKASGIPLSASRSRLRNVSGSSTGDLYGEEIENSPQTMNSEFRRPLGMPSGSTAVKYGAAQSIPSSSSNFSSAAAAAASKRSTSLPRHKQPIARGYLATSKGSGTAGAGAVDEDDFANAFDDAPKIQFFSGKELLNHLLQIRETLADANADWEKRLLAVKKVRSVVLADACQYEEFMSELKNFELPFQMLVKDLRSQVVREACITIAFLSQKLGNRFEHFAESVLLGLINLIQNSAKIMATSGHVACRYIIKNTPTPKLIPIIIGTLTSKSREIRRASAEFICLMCYGWPTGAMEKNVTNIQEAIRHTLSDADPDARQAARKAYWGFRDRFKDHAEALFQSLEPAKQRHLMGEISQSSSSNSIAAVRASQENLHAGQMSVFKTPARSTSDIDTGAQRRARRGYMATLSSQANRTPRVAAPPLGTPHNMNSLPRVPKSSQRQHPVGITTTDSTSSTSRSASKSISQPGSRSSSPSSRLPTTTAMARRYRATPTTTRSCLPVRSHGGSREQSPSRSGGRRYSTGENGQATTPVGSSRYLTHDMDINALLNSRRVIASDFNDMESETSSVCSERSFSAVVNRQATFENKEFNELLASCQSPQWSERKEGLSGLQALFKTRRPFTASELKRICDTLARFLVDTHNKTFNLFLDTLVEYLAAYRSELSDWLFVLLTRLLMKQGSDLLASVENKLMNTLDVVRESFPYQLQFNTLIRYIVDPFSTPSLKMKTAVLNYVNQLANCMDASNLKNVSDVRLAISKIISWITEPKSAEVRRASQSVLVSLFSLNAAEFSAILNTFPKQQQDVVYSLLQSHLAKGPSSSMKSRSTVSPGPFGPSSHVDLDSVHDSLKRTSEEIQQYSFTGLQKVIGSQDSGIVDAVDSFHRGDNDITNGRLLIEQLHLNTDEETQQEIIEQILTELSNHNRRHSERRKAMTTLRCMTRDGSFTLWDKHFKTILLILLETLGDDDKEIRSSALRLLGDICVAQSTRFRDYAELTVLKVLEAHKDPDKGISRAADECAQLLAANLPPRTCLRILKPMIKTEDTRATLAAIKMVTKVVEQLSASDAEQVLGDVVPGIIHGYENPDESVVRKASLFCLVALHNLVGQDALAPYLTSLSSSKVRLLNLYLKRAGTQSVSPTSRIANGQTV